jgi:peptide deformylase
MGKLKIISFGDHVLRQPAKPVTVFHKKLHALIDSIAETLHNCDGGAALAANQVDVLKRITVINYQGEYFELINPEIIYSEGEQTDMEGCLSFPGYYGLVKRFNLVKVKYLDRNGKENVIERTGKLARCIQHEVDHLNGVLFVDRMIEDFLIHTETENKISLQSALDLANGKKGM